MAEPTRQVQSSDTLSYSSKLVRSVSAMSDGARLALWLALAYALLIVLGVIVFRLPGATIAGNEMSFERSVFTVVNAATLTGFQQAVALDEYGASGQICVIGLTVAGTLFSLMIGGIALNQALKLQNSDMQIVWATLFTFVFSVLGSEPPCCLSLRAGCWIRRRRLAARWGIRGFISGGCRGLRIGGRICLCCRWCLLAGWACQCF